MQSALLHNVQVMKIYQSYLCRGDLYRLQLNKADSSTHLVDDADSQHVEKCEDTHCCQDCYECLHKK